MIEIIKAVNWPSAVIVLGIVAMVLFRRPLGMAIQRVRKVSKEGVEVSVEAGQKTEETPRRNVDDLMKAFDSPLLLEQEKRIRNDLQSKGLQGSADAVNVLIRHLAAFQIGYGFEVTYPLIWGSQLLILQNLNSNPLGNTLTALHAFYEIAANQHPAVFAGYAFENYIAFLESTGLVSRTGDRLTITLAGREFLSYLARTGKSTVKLF